LPFWSHIRAYGPLPGSSIDSKKSCCLCEISNKLVRKGCALQNIGSARAVDIAEIVRVVAAARDHLLAVL
jgi:hypothetical protein